MVVTPQVLDILVVVIGLMLKSIKKREADTSKKK